jgi:ABC-type transport system substrate-binding protein
MKILFLTLLILISCTKKRNTLDNKTLNLALSADISTLDPAISYDGASAQLVYQSFETLYEYDYLARPYKLKPLLAKELPKLDKSRTKYLIKIKKGVQYHEDPAFKGKKRFLKAQDFINQFKRLAYIPTRSSGWWLIDGKIKGINEFRKNAGSDFNLFKKLNVSGLRIIDDHSFEIELTKPFPQMIFALAMSFTAPMPMEVIEFYNNGLSIKMVGTGPFYLKNYNPLQGALLKRFRPYHGDGPWFDQVNYLLMKEDQTRWLNFLSGKIDIINLPVDNFFSAIENDKLSRDLIKKGIGLKKSPTLTYWWISFNMGHPILGKNKILRSAIAHAINRKEYLKLFTNNTGILANSIYPPGVPGYNKNHKLPYNYNLKKAKALMAKAGYPKGRGLPEFNFDTRSTRAKSRQQAEFIKKELAKIGIKIKINTNTFPRFLTKAREGKLNFWYDGWAMDYPHAENSLQLLLEKNHPPGPNSTYYTNPEFENLFKKFATSVDDQITLMEKMEDVVERDLPWIMLYYDSKFILYNQKIKNYKPSGLINNDLKYLKPKS